MVVSGPSIFLNSLSGPQGRQPPFPNKSNDSLSSITLPKFLDLCPGKGSERLRDSSKNTLPGSGGAVWGPGAISPSHLPLQRHPRLPVPSGPASGSPRHRIKKNKCVEAEEEEACYGRRQGFWAGVEGGISREGGTRGVFGRTSRRAAQDPPETRLGPRSRRH